jgi:hypothetical protein
MNDPYRTPMFVATVEDVKCYRREIDRLKKENGELRDDIKKAVNTGDRAMIIAKENINLKSRIDRAVKYLKDNDSHYIDKTIKILTEGDK